MLLLVFSHIHFAVTAMPFSVPQGLSPWFAITFAKGQFWSSKAGEVHPGYRTLLHFQVSLVTCPLLVEPSIPRATPESFPATDRTRVCPGTRQVVGFLQLLSVPRLWPSANISIWSSPVNVAVNSKKRDNFFFYEAIFWFWLISQI